MNTIRHMKLDIRGYLMNHGERDMVGLFKHDDGRPMNGYEAKAELLEELAKGKKFLPVGDCPGFDPQTGCPGHEEKAADELARLAVCTDHPESDPDSCIHRRCHQIAAQLVAANKEIASLTRASPDADYVAKLEARVELDAKAFEGAVRQLDAETHFSLRDLMTLAAKANRALLAAHGKGDGAE